MKLLDFIYKLCFEARRIPNIGFICPDGNIYNLNHFQNIKYPAFCASQLQHSEEGDWRYYQFNLFYVDRLVSSHKNTQEIQSEAVDALSRIIRNITSYGIETRGSVLYDVFTEKFDSECAGAYATVTFGTMVDDVCPEWYDTPLYLIKWTSEAEMQPNDYYFTPEGDYYMLSDEYYKIIYQGHDEHTGYLVYTDTSPKDGAGEYGGTFAIRDASVTTLDLSQANSTDFKIDSLSYNPMKELTFNQTLIELGDLRGLPLKSLMLPKSIKRFSGYVFGNEYGSQWKLPTVGYEGTMAEFEAIEKSDDWSGGTSNFGSLQYIQCSDGIICLRDCTDTFPYFTGVTTGDTDVQCRTIPFEEKIPYEFGDEDYLYIMGWNLSRSTSDAPARVCLENGTGRLVARQTGDIRNSSISSNYGLRPWVTFRVHYFTPSDSSDGIYIELPYEGKWLTMNGVGQVITTTGQTTLFYYAEDGEGNTWLETGDHLALSVDNSGYLVGRRYGDGFALTWGQLKDLCSDPGYPYCTYDFCLEDFCYIDCLTDGACESDCASDIIGPDESGLTGCYRMVLVTGITEMDADSHYVLADPERYVYVSDYRIKDEETEPDYYYLYKSSGYTLTDGYVTDISDWAVFKLRLPISTDEVCLYLADNASVRFWSPDGRKNIAFTYLSPRGFILQSDGSLLNIDNDGRYLGYFHLSTNVGMRVPGYEGHKKLYLYKLVKGDCPEPGPTGCTNDCYADATEPQYYEMEKITDISDIDTGATYVLANDSVMAYRHNIDPSYQNINNFYLSGYTSEHGIVEDIDELSFISIPRTGISSNSGREYFQMASGGYAIYSEGITDTSTDVTATTLRTTSGGNFGFGFYQDGRIFDLMWESGIEMNYSLVDYSNPQWNNGMELVAQDDAQTYDALYLYKITLIQ